MKTASAPRPILARPAASLAAALILALAMTLLLGPIGRADAAPPKRIVAITPFAANTMAFLGKKPVAVGETLGGDRRLAPVLNRTKKLTLTHPNGPNLEELANLKPDLVFSSTRWKKGTQAMKQLGIKVIYADPVNLKQVYDKTTAIARIIGKKAEGKRRVKQMRSQVRKSTAGATAAEHPKVMLILGVGRTPFTFLHNSWGGQILDAAGADLQTGGATASGGFARISDELVIAQQPDIIIAVPHGNSDDIPSVRDYIEDNEAWKQTPAVEDGNIYISTNNSLLQAGTDPGAVIKFVRKNYLKNFGG